MKDIFKGLEEIMDRYGVSVSISGDNESVLLTIKTNGLKVLYWIHKETKTKELLDEIIRDIERYS